MKPTAFFCRPDIDKNVNCLREAGAKMNGPRRRMAINKLISNLLENLNAPGRPFSINERYCFENTIRKYYSANPRFKPKRLKFM